MTKRKETGNGVQWDSLQEVLDSTKGKDALRKGQQQFLTPLEIARVLSRPLAPVRPVAVDLQMGHGSLLLGSHADTLLGADIDKAVARKPMDAPGEWEAFQADTTLLAPILHECGWQADLFTCNPPFSLQWEAKRLDFLSQSVSQEIRRHFALGTKHGAINSGLATALLMLEFMTTRGEGCLILSDTVARSCFGSPNQPSTLNPQPSTLNPHPVRSHVWLWLTIPGSIFPNVNSIDTAVVYLARDHRRDEPLHVTATGKSPEAILAALQGIHADRWKHRGGISVEAKPHGSDRTVPLCDVARQEYAMRHGGKARPFNIWIDGNNIIHRHLTPFQSLSGRVPKALVESLYDLQGQTPMALVVQKNTRLALQRAVTSDVWVVDPKLPPLVEKCIADYHAARAPFYPLSEVQRIGYVDESDTLKCKAAGLNGFEIGKCYALASQTTAIGRTFTRKNIEGSDEQLLTTGQDLVITLTDARGKVHKFMQFPEMELNSRGEVQVDYVPDPTTHNLQTLIAHFEIPEVPDIASCRQDEYRAALDRLSALEKRWGITFKRFQKDDLARGSLIDGYIKAWAAGLGKTFAIFARPFLTGAKRVLIVAPDSLHQQLCKEGRDKFGVEVRDLMSQQDFYDDEELQKVWLELRNAECGTRKADPAPALNPRIDPEVGAAILAFLSNPTTDTWDAIAHTYAGINPDRIPCPFSDRKAPDTIWQVVCDCDRTFPKKGRSSTMKGKMIADWERIPTPQELINALKQVGAWVGAPVDQPSTLNHQPSDPTFWITSYTALGMNKADEWEPVVENGLTQLNEARMKTRRDHETYDADHDFGIGTENAQGIRCVFTPTLARLVGDVFDCVEIDEGCGSNRPTPTPATASACCAPNGGSSAPPRRSRTGWRTSSGWRNGPAAATPSRPPAGPTPPRARRRRRSPTSTRSTSATSPARPSMSGPRDGAAGSRSARRKSATSTGSGNCSAPSSSAAARRTWARTSCRRFSSRSP